MTREHTVAVKLKEGCTAATYCAGQFFELSLKEGETASKWKNGAPILRADFEHLLKPAGHFEIVTIPAKGGDGPVRTRATKPARAGANQEE